MSLQGTLALAQTARLSVNTPRFSHTNRTQASILTLDTHVVPSPGPACYETRVNSCVRNTIKQIKIPMAKRFTAPKPIVNPHAPLYDTRQAVVVLRKRSPTVRIAEAKRKISPHLFHAKCSKAISKGLFMKQ